MKSIITYKTNKNASKAGKFSAGMSRMNWLAQLRIKKNNFLTTQEILSSGRMSKQPKLQRNLATLIHNLINLIELKS